MSEQLIYALSAMGELRTEQFNDIFKKLYVPSRRYKEEEITTDARLQVVRLLDALGYCEFDFKAHKIFMCEPQLVLLPHYGVPRAVLVGARTPYLVAKIREAVKRRREVAMVVFATQETAQVNIPASIQIEAIDVGVINEIGKEVGIKCSLEQPTAWALAHFASSIEEVKNALLFESRDEPNWRKRIFVPDKLMFSRYATGAVGGLQLVEYINPDDQQRHHWLWNESNAAEVGRDMGRYVALASQGANILLYDKLSHKMAVPISVPLPCIFSRALALCSGKVPLEARTGESKLGHIPAGYPVYVYRDVSPDIALLVARKLGQGLIFSGLDLFRGRDVIYD